MLALIRYGSILDNKYQDYVVLNPMTLDGRVLDKNVNLKFPELSDALIQAKNNGQFKIGNGFLYNDKDGLKIINIPIFDDNNTLSFENIEKGLKWLVNKYKYFNVDKLIVPDIMVETDEDKQKIIDIFKKYLSDIKAMIYIIEPKKRLA